MAGHASGLTSPRIWWTRRRTTVCFSRRAEDGHSAAQAAIDQWAARHIGDQLSMRFAKAGEVFEGLDVVYAIADDEVVGLPTYRGERENLG